MITSFFRTIILYGILVVAIRFMGKRQIGQLQPTELVVMILISELASIPMQDVGIPLVNGVIPILTLLATEMIMSYAISKNVRFRQCISGSTSILMMRGVINQKELKRLRISVEELLEELRLKDVFDITTVDCAFLETNGQISVLLKPCERTVTPSQMQVETDEDAVIYTTLAVHGRVLKSNLKACGRDEKWLQKKMKENNINSEEDIFLCITDDKGNVVMTAKNEERRMISKKEG